MPLTYLDFDVEIVQQDDHRYTVAVRSHAGQVRQTVAFPFSDAELETHLLQIENALLRSTSQRRTLLTPEEDAVRTFGQQLFDFLLSGELRSLYYECHREANHQGKGVRVKLNIQPPQLAALPWEFLFDPRKRDYVCLDPNTPLVRYNDLPQTVPPLLMTLPLRILGMVAAPTDLPRLDVVQEQARITQAVQPLQARGLVELTWLAGQTWRDLQQIMRPGYGPWHIFHFIGHSVFDAGRDEGRLALADDQGRADLKSALQFARLLAHQRSSLRLVLLNSCEGARGGQLDPFASTAATLIQNGLPAVLAMQYAITNLAAVEFSRTFYEALADNLPVDAAVADARNAINLQNEYSLEWGTPVLYMRAPDGMLFSATGVTSQSVSVPEPIQPMSSSQIAETKAMVTNPVDDSASQIVSPSTTAKPPDRPALFIKLRSVLATLYPDETSARRIATDAGLDITRVAFTGQTTNTWHAILREADHTNRVNAVLAQAEDEYGNNPALQEVLAAWRAQASAPRSARSNTTPITVEAIVKKYRQRYGRRKSRWMLCRSTPQQPFRSNG